MADYLLEDMAGLDRPTFQRVEGQPRRVDSSWRFEGLRLPGEPEPFEPELSFDCPSPAILSFCQFSPVSSVKAFVFPENWNCNFIRIFYFCLLSEYLQSYHKFLEEFIYVVNVFAKVVVGDLLALVLGFGPGCLEQGQQGVRLCEA